MPISLVNVKISSVSRMITSMKSTPKRALFKHGVVRFYSSVVIKYIGIGGVNMRE